MSSACTGTMSSVMSPSRLASSAGSVKPVLSRSNHAGPETAAKMSRMIASAARRRTPRFQRAT